MANIINKVVYDGNTLIDLTGDTVEQNKVLYGYTFHYKDGTTKTGSCTYDANTSDATAASSEILSTKTAYVNGSKVTGSMTNNGAVTLTIDDKSDELTIPSGYHDGSGKAKLDSTEKSKIVAGNIKQGVTILGVLGTYSGASISAQSKTVTPDATGFTVQPDEGYDYLSSVVVNAIPYSETLNAAGGYTATIG